MIAHDRDADAKPPLHQIAQHQRNPDHGHARGRHQAGRHRNEAGPVRHAHGADMADQPVRGRNGEAEQDEEDDPSRAPVVVCSLVLSRSSRLVCHRPLVPSISQIHPPAAGRPGIRRSHSPSRGAASGRRDSRCGSPRPADRRKPGRRCRAPSAKVAALSIHISGVWMTKRRSMPRLSASCMALMVSSRQSG